MTNQDDSFLIEDQKAGRATEKLDLSNLQEAMDAVCVIMNQEAVELYKNKKEEDWPTATLETYCQDCRNIVPSGIGQTRRGKQRIVCGTCKSKKIARGRHDALEKFYHIKEREEKEAEKAEKRKARDAATAKPEAKGKGRKPAPKKASPRK